MLRALLVSSGSCGLAYVAACMLVDLWAGREPRVLMAIGFAAPLTLIVAGAALLVQWPILRALRSRNRTLLISAGALLAAVPFAALFGLVLTFFGDPKEEPATLAEFVRFWLRVPGEFLVPFLPMALSGGLLGLFASEQLARSRAHKHLDHHPRQFGV